MRISRAEIMAPGLREVSGLSGEVRGIAHVLHSPDDLQPLYDYIGDARIVLLGEASHGTSEYYSWRARITQRLIREMNFSFVAVEGDWPDCYEVNRYVKGYPDSGASAREVLGAFERWPAWMWANWEIAAFAEWLRVHNEGQLPGEHVGFYGLDVYSLWESLKAIVDYLERVDPHAAEIARRAYSCFEPYGEDVEEYALSTALVPDSCESEVVEMLREIRARARQYPDDHEGSLNAEQNAQVAVEAERYYRTMVRGGASTWNIRDSHMADTLDRLLKHHGPASRAAVWEHNTHIGDARATDMVEIGEVSVGQLARERHSGDGAVLVGFGSHRGTVIASRRWGGPMETMIVPPAAAGSWEDVMHAVGPESRLLVTADAPDTDEWLRLRGHRAIGVVYDPETERLSNYVPTVLPERYDAFIYFDETTALHPLRREPGRVEEAPEAYPWGI